MFLRDVLQALEEGGVEYCVVGGVAVALHGIPRTTFDVDIAVPREHGALARAEAVLERLGLVSRLPIRLASVADLTREELAERNLIAITFTDPRDPLREVDVLVNPPVSGRELVDRSVRLESRDLAARVATVADLVAMKRAAGREQDLADVAHLERLLGAKR